MQQPTNRVPHGSKRKRNKIEKTAKKTVTRKCPAWDGRYERKRRHRFKNRGWIKDRDMKLELILASRLVSRIRILGNKLFQLYLRLCVEKFNSTKDEQQLVEDIKITQDMIQHAYQAIKNGDIEGTVPLLFRQAFRQFTELQGVAQKLDAIKADSKYRNAYLTEMLNLYYHGISGSACS